MPARRWTDGGEASTDRAFDLLREDMQKGFEGVNVRLDRMNGRVNEHGESIATLRQGCLGNAVLAGEVRELAQSFAAHRARCPYDGSGEASDAANARWTNAQLAGSVAGGSAATLVLLEVIQWFVQRHLGR